MNEFLAMGGYAGFIWPAYGVVLLVLTGLWWFSRRALAQSDADLRVLEAQRPTPRRGANPKAPVTTAANPGTSSPAHAGAEPR